MTATNQEAGFYCAMMRHSVTNSCEEHADRHDCPDMLVDRVRGGYGLMIRSDAGGRVIEIRYCPWCGTSLPPIQDLDLS